MKSLDTFGLLCPMPIIKLSEAIQDVEPGGAIEILSDDLGILEDLPAWCKSHGHELLELEPSGEGEYRGVVKRKLDR